MTSETPVFQEEVDSIRRQAKRYSQGVRLRLSPSDTLGTGHVVLSRVETPNPKP